MCTLVAEGQKSAGMNSAGMKGAGRNSAKRRQEQRRQEQRRQEQRQQEQRQQEQRRRREETVGVNCFSACSRSPLHLAGSRCDWRQNGNRILVSVCREGCPWLRSKGCPWA